MLMLIYVRAAIIDAFAIRRLPRHTLLLPDSAA